MNALYEIVPHHMDSSQLTPLYARLFEKFKEADEGNMMWFEPAQFPDELPGVVWSLGFKNPPGANIGSSNHVLNDHSYCCQRIPSVCAKKGEPQPENAQECFNWHDQRISTRSNDAKKLGIPLIISEFGTCGDSDNCIREIDQVGEMCDRNLASWAYWEFKPFHDFTTSSGNRSE